MEEPPMTEAAAAAAAAEGLVATLTGDQPDSADDTGIFFDGADGASGGASENCVAATDDEEAPMSIR
jgi:hypothetical protein